jgi:hypothetical protein
LLPCSTEKQIKSKGEIILNKKIGIVGSIINLITVVGFAVSMIAGTLFGSYLTSLFIAWSLVAMLCSFAYYSDTNKRVAGLCAVAFGIMYAICNSFVYFAQITTVQMDTLTEQAAKLLDFQNYGLFFNYDMLGYCLMAVSTFFAGLTIDPKIKTDKWLKWLLLIHGVFAISCFILPMLGLFSTAMSGGEWIGTAILVFWCIYFAPISILSFLHFKSKTE